MSKDFNSNQGGVQSSTSTQFDALESDKPTTGFVEAPSSDKADSGPGKGIGNSRRGIH